MQLVSSQKLLPLSYVTRLNVTSKVEYLQVNYL